MKTMTETECRAFVMSGFVPTSNEDIADIQDCFNHQSIDFQLGLLIDPATHEKAERLMRWCLHSVDEVDMLLAQAEDVRNRLALREVRKGQIDFWQNQITAAEMYLEQTEADAERYGKYMCVKL